MGSQFQGAEFLEVDKEQSGRRAFQGKGTAGGIARGKEDPRNDRSTGNGFSWLEGVIEDAAGKENTGVIL